MRYSPKKNHRAHEYSTDENQQKQQKTESDLQQKQQTTESDLQRIGILELKDTVSNKYLVVSVDKRSHQI